MDANTYIQAKNEYYHMDVVPGYWEWLDTQFQLGTLASVSMVYDELKGYEDELTDWVKPRKEHFMDVSDDETQAVFSEIIQLLADNDFTSKDTDNFLAGADPWLVAKAKVTDAAVVTLESLVPENSKKIKIPNVCRQLDIEYINTFKLLRLLEAKFVLDKGV